MLTSYQWWTVRAWWTPADRGVKLGPLSIQWYQWHGWQVMLAVNGLRFLREPLIDTGVWRHR